MELENVEDKFLDSQEKLEGDCEEPITIKIKFDNETEK